MLSILWIDKLKSIFSYLSISIDRYENIPCGLLLWYFIYVQYKLMADLELQESFFNLNQMLTLNGKNHDLATTKTPQENPQNFTF